MFVVHILCSPGLRQRHWDKMNEIIGFSTTPDSCTSLRKMLKYNLEPYLEQFEGISAGASKEYSLEKAMQKMEDDWDPIIFNTILYRYTGWGVCRREREKEREREIERKGGREKEKGREAS